ncbi:MAG: TM2 domain-containing protein [Pseudomonadota bacterium]
MRQDEKHLLTAYLFALFGPLGAHRMYLGLWMTAVFMLIGLMGGVVLLVLAIGTGDPVRISLYSLPLAAMTTWWVIDLISLPGMVERVNGSEENRKPFVSIAAVNLDPSFSATRRTLGATEEHTGRSALPDDYVRPWQKEHKEAEIVRYRSEE